jgi:HD-GYP domain-containing protein (c-di-GMP phosphodiesterase class II)
MLDENEERVGVTDGLVGLMVAHDGATGMHLIAVGDLSRRLAQHLGLSDEAVQNISLAGRLHDLGKLLISAETLNKPGSLDEAEWAKVRRHPERGAHIVGKFPSLSSLARIILLHHERIDGTGYPYGLVGSDIPFEARLIAIVDAFHAMTVPRAYSQARGADRALVELQRCAGTQFDAEIVEAFGDMLVGAERSQSAWRLRAG